MTKRLSRPDCLHKLLSLWDAVYTQSGYLKSVSIDSITPLRGIKQGSLKLEFPVTVICGENGSGKTTFLSLAILGFHASKKPITPLKNIEYFDFNYFFRSAANDRHDQGIQIQWKYTDGKEDAIEKGSQRWLRYIKNNGEPRRRVRGTEFIGISRITPAFEKKNYSNYFSKGTYKENQRSEKLRQYMSTIMGKQYIEVSELSHSNSGGIHTVQNYNKTHTSFNAGAGEECLANIIGTLLDCEEGSIVAIEEIEIGLHPSTLSRLSDAILEIAQARKLQVLITSHSAEFLRAFPKEGLILASRSGNEINFINQPNVEYAISRIGGHHRAAAHIICEDLFAAAFIKSILPAKLRVICPVVCFGGKDALIPKAEILSNHPDKQKIVIIWDGDVDTSYPEGANKKGFLGLKLHSSLNPEQLIIDKLNTSQGREFLSGQFRLDSAEVSEALNRINTIKDPHDKNSN
jgi:predicted ATPase